MASELGMQDQRNNARYELSISHLQEQIDALNAQKAASGMSATSTEVVIIKNPAIHDVFGLKPTKLPIYEGNRQSYPAWRRAVLSIFRMDWNTFAYDNQRAFLMIYNALRGEAQRKSVSFFEVGGVNGTQRPEDFLEFLDRTNYDPTRIDRAANELYDMKMGERQSWPNFFAEWANKLSEAHCDGWSGRSKIVMLRNALNDKLLKALAGNHLLPKNDYNEWVQIVGQISQQLEMVGARSRHRNSQCLTSPAENFRVRHEEARPGNMSRSQNNFARQGEIDASGDTIMGEIMTSDMAPTSGSERRRAKWKSPSQIKKLRDENLCFRCERRGCSTKTCPLAPAVRPKEKRGLKANATNLPPIDPSMWEQEFSEYIGDHGESEN